MKVIDVLAKLANDEIKDGTELEVHDSIGRTLKYTFYGKLKVFRDERFDGMDRWFSIDNSFLNLEVDLIPPKPKKFYLRLDEDDKFSYINKNVYFSYEVANKSEHTNYKTKFTQEEIDESMLLKFIEKHGIKEEAGD